MPRNARVLLYGENSLCGHAMLSPLQYSGVRDREAASQLACRAASCQIVGEHHYPNDSTASTQIQALLSPLRKLAYQNRGVDEVLGDRLRQARDRLGLTQTEAAEKIGLSYAAIGQWERGETIPELENLVPCAQVYGASLDWLVWDMGYNFDARVAAIPALLRQRLIDDLARKIEETEALAKRLPPELLQDTTVGDKDPRLKKWAATTKKKRDLLLGKKKRRTSG